ncbi:transposase [Sulfoacidibacillus thermotolerans]|uniref:transposase n=1 Tax=Sulfoacidibacillus thermotolerans TaxID=1765684 RepID=UPI003CCC4C44
MPAVTLVAEIGKFSRFRNPKQLMAYARLVPKEYSSRASRWQGGSIKTGKCTCSLDIIRIGLELSIQTCGYRRYST